MTPVRPVLLNIGSDTPVQRIFQPDKNSSPVNCPVEILVGGGVP